jgi:hypothetical protein
MNDDPSYRIEYETLLVGKVLGATQRNDDGSRRQEILSRCAEGERLRLVRLSDDPADPKAIALDRENGERIGYLENRPMRYVAARVCVLLDSGERLQAMIEQIGESPKRKTKGCVVSIRYA